MIDFLMYIQLHDNTRGGWGGRWSYIYLVFKGPLLYFFVIGDLFKEFQQVSSDMFSSQTEADCLLNANMLGISYKSVFMGKITRLLQ